MSEPPVTSESMTGQAADWVSTILSVVLIWPKTVALSVVAIVAFIGAIWFFADSRPVGPPPPNAAVLQQMMRAVEEADRRVRAEHGSRIEPHAEYNGVFETMRDRPQPAAEQVSQNQGNQL